MRCPEMLAGLVATVATALLIVPQAGAQVSEGVAPSPMLTLRGTIGDRLGVLMTLSPEPKGRATLTGDYHYEKTEPYVPHLLSLRGERKAEQITLTETDETGKVTGRFSGTLSAAAPRRLKGTWSSPDGTRTLPFVLSEYRLPPPGIRIQEGQRRESGKKPVPYGIDVTWPRLTGASSSPGTKSFNTAMEEAGRAEIARFRKGMREMGAETPLSPDISWELSSSGQIASITDRTVSGSLDVYAFMGGAHGSSFTRTITTDRRTGARLSLSDLFAPGTDAVALLARLCRPPLLADIGKDAFFAEGVEPRPENFRKWTLEPRGLVITFDVYQVAPYAMGPREVVLPWPVLKPYLRSDGPATPFLR